MLNGLIITAYILWIAGFFVNGFGLYNILLVIPTTMFAVRKVGIHVKMSNIIALECVLLFFKLVFALILHKLVIWKLLVGLLLRAIFFGIVIYDDTTFVYVSEERKKQ